MPELPFSLQLEIPEDRLTSLKDSVNGRLDSVAVSNIPGFEYYLSIFPNGYADVSRQFVQICLFLNLENLEKVEADFTVTIETANYSHKNQYTFKKFCSSWHPNIAATEDFFNPEKKFIVDGKCTVKVNGIFKWETEDFGKSDLEEQKWEGGELGDELWKKNDNKDFAICVDGKELKIHKNVFGARSDVFAAMFEARMKESIESKVEIPDFSFKVVETAVKMIYHCHFTSFLSIDEIMSLLHFFDKYQIPILKDKVESCLIRQISAATVCRLTNFSMLSNSSKLKNKCIEFLKTFYFQTPLSDTEILGKDVLLEVVQIFACQTLTLQ